MCNGLRQVGIPLRTLRKKYHMTTVALASTARGELCTEYGGQLQLPRGFSKTHYSVEPIAVGKSKRLQAKRTGMLGKLLGRRGSC